jgi:hypothetical protein
MGRMFSGRLVRSCQVRCGVAAISENSRSRTNIMGIGPYGVGSPTHQVAADVWYRTRPCESIIGPSHASKTSARLAQNTRWGRPDRAAARSHFRGCCQ